jgi:hypothetical protein
MDCRTSYIIVSESDSGRVFRTLVYLDIRPCLLVSARHDAGAISGTLFSSGDTGSNEADALGSEIFGAAIRIGVMGVSAVDDDVALLDTSLVEKKLDEVVNRLSSHDEHHHATRLLELLYEFLDGMCANNGLALGLCEIVSLLRQALRGKQALPSFKNRSTLDTLAESQFAFQLTGSIRPAHVRLNATTCSYVSVLDLSSRLLYGLSVL